MEERDYARSRATASETGAENVDRIKALLTSMNVGPDSHITLTTEDHANMNAFVREVHLEDEEPYLLVNASPYKRVRVALKNIKSLEPAESA